MTYAQGKYAFGYCDICSFRYPINDLKFEVENGLLTKRRVCPTCWSPDHPQNMLGRLKIWDPQSLRDPRPEPNIDQSRSLFGWNPVGHELMYLTVAVGTVTVTEA